MTSLILLQTSRSFLTYLEKQAKIDEDNVTLLENLPKNCAKPYGKARQIQKRESN